MNLKELVNNYIKFGYKIIDAESKVCQDIILLKIANSKFSKNITIKGGVVIHNISKDLRRATHDLDLDFIRYSLDDNSIKKFIKELSRINDGIRILVNGDITKLQHQDYDGKRVNIELYDKYNNSIKAKLDIGVHKEIDIEQDKYCFDLSIIDKSANLLINSKEQIFVEKIKSLLKLGFRSTRYKDLFDFYYLINIEKLDKQKLMKCFNILIFNDNMIRENNIEDVLERLKMTFNSNAYRKNLSNPKNNWLSISIEDAIYSVLEYIEELNRDNDIFYSGYTF